eukprot:gene7643-15650_t
MPKILKTKRQRLTSHSTPYPESTKPDAELSTNDPKLSKGQKKRRLRNNQVLSKLGKNDILNLKKAPKDDGKKENKLALLLGELEASLPETEVENIDSKQKPLFKSNKTKKTIAMRETERMRLVQQHPAFQIDPLAAMKSHIEQLVMKTNGQGKKK